VSDRITPSGRIVLRNPVAAKMRKRASHRSLSVNVKGVEGERKLEACE
jgi:hypothetical protein